MEPVLRLEKVTRIYTEAHGKQIRVLEDASFSIKGGQIVSLVAPSGAGKSTLLHLAGLLERPGSGEVHIGGRATVKLPDEQRTALRRNDIGFIYQFHHLLPEFSALENLVIPQMLRGVDREAANGRGMELLSFMGLEARADHRPSELSGGEQQRVAIARAVANGPKLLLADEPTGNLDPETSERVFSVLDRLVRSTGLSALIATHNHDLARRMDRIVTLEDARVVDCEL
ncbi:ABC transporter ATP-binding protein [Salaquimonas pukyongi]|uniref:ABC transporter ATP-binding protein n=1 Tax=Salaquimonas pukyongi TaxID=2712698 RepID=UPI00096B8DB8|nr:ABC transporter ATP-binding protein [Salaquimonas pukyongi]